MFSLINKRSIGVGGDEVGRGFAKFSEDLSDSSMSFTLVREVRAAGDPFDSSWTGGGEQNRAGAFAEDRAPWWLSKRFDGRRGTKEAPFAVGVAEEPVGFLSGDNDAVIESVAEHQVLGHFQGEDADGAVADEGASRSRCPTSFAQ